MPTRLALVLALVTTAGVVSAAPDAPPYDVRSYHLAVRLEFERSPEPGSPFRNLASPTNTLRASATITVANVGDAPLTELPLLLHRLLEVEAVSTGGRALSFTTRLTGLTGQESLQILQVTVPLADPLAPGGELTLTIRYRGQLVGYPESGMLYVRETLDPDFTILRSETFCYPQVAAPTRQATAWAARHDAFAQHLEVTVPEGHVVVNGGQLVDRDAADGLVTYTYRGESPEATIVLAIAPYRTAAIGPHRIYHFATSGEHVAELAGRLEEAVALLTAWFGPLPLDRGMTVAEIPDFFGSQAGSMIIQTSAAFRQPERYHEFYHELSHLWNPPDIDAEPTRWNEGLATFLEALVAERMGNDGALERSLERILAGLRRRLEKSPELAGVAMIDYGRRGLTDLSYSTGALFFARLADTIGEDSLLAFVARYSRDKRSGGSTDLELAREVSALGPEAAEIVREWLLTPAFADRVLAADSWSDLR